MVIPSDLSFFSLFSQKNIILGLNNDMKAMYFSRSYQTLTLSRCHANLVRFLMLSRDVQMPGKRKEDGGRRPLTAAEIASRGDELALLFTQYLISADFK